MRWISSCAFLVLAAGTLGQSLPDIQTTLNAPDATITVTKHRTGADLVEIRMRDADFPVEKLAFHIDQLGKQLGMAPRGATPSRMAIGDNPNLVFVSSGKFAVDGLIDRSTGRLGLRAITRAFTDSAEPRVKSLHVIFDGETPGTDTIQNFSSSSVVVQGQFFDGRSGPRGIEYRVAPLTTDANKIDIPDRVERNDAKPSSTTQPSGLGWPIWTLLGVASVAAGALVYFLLLRSASPARR
jgi:hypothetical protein